MPQLIPSRAAAGYADTGLFLPARTNDSSVLNPDFTVADSAAFTKKRNMAVVSDKHHFAVFHTPPPQGE
jgi:hypothetical protein